ncbi:MAG: AAC(3) family N-acetyltransferase [Desulfovibrio sp.]
MRTVTPGEVREALTGLGVGRGDVLMLHSDITRIGLMAGASSREAVLAGYFTALTEAVGPEGTIAALACTESYARHGRPYVHETSPSEQGVLSEYIRTRPGAVRSVHPLFSVCAAGAQADALCADTSASAFGYNSPFERMLRLDAKIVCLGTDLHSMTFVHHVEQTYGVPYGYTKEWTAPAEKDGRPLPRRAVAFVRYLGCGVDYDFTRLQDRLFALGLARKAALGLGAIFLTRCRDVFAVGMRSLDEDLFFFLKSPPSREPWKGAACPNLNASKEKTD